MTTMLIILWGRFLEPDPAKVTLLNWVHLHWFVTANRLTWYGSHHIIYGFWCTYFSVLMCYCLYPSLPIASVVYQTKWPTLYSSCEIVQNNLKYYCELCNEESVIAFIGSMLFNFELGLPRGPCFFILWNNLKFLLCSPKYFNIICFPKFNFTKFPSFEKFWPIFSWPPKNIVKKVPHNYNKISLLQACSYHKLSYYSNRKL